MADQRTFPHHMIKEIFEQPRGLLDTIAPRVDQRAGRVQLNEVPISPEEVSTTLRGAPESSAICSSGTER